MTYPTAWDWRLGYNHGFFDDESGLPTFHAYDVNDNAACERWVGLVGTIENANEGSHLCAPCMTHVRSHPEGREQRATARPDVVSVARVGTSDPVEGGQ